MRRWLVWIAVAVAVPALVGGWLLRPGSLDSAYLLPIAVSFLAVGALLALKRPENPIGWLFLGFGLVASLNYPAEQYAGHVPHYAHTDVVASIAAHFWHPFFGLFVFAFLLFPDGHLVSPRWRWVAWVAAIDYVLLGLTSPLDTSYVGPDYPGAKALFSGPVSDADTIVHGLLLSFNLLLLPVAGASLVVRLRRSTGRRREQVRLFVYTVAAVMLAFPLFLLTTGSAYGVLLLPLIPVSAGVAILRHRLFDLDIVINRALVYGALTVALGAVYLALVLLIGLAVGRSGFAVAVSTLAVAALFRPARARIQGGRRPALLPPPLRRDAGARGVRAAAARRARPRGARRRPARRGRRHGPARARVAVAAEGAVNGEDALVTVLFVDIRDFTPFADRATAREAVALLNEFFGVVVPVLEEHGGRVQAFLGDGMLGVFGAPEPLPDHADRGVAAARAIVASVEAHFGDRCRVSVGVNSGLVIVGTIGGGSRFELGIIGDPVNVAARVEQATRRTGDSVLVTEATRCLLERDGLVPRGAIELKGKPAPVAVYALGAEA